MGVKENLDDIRERIAKACHRSGRSPDSVALAAVSKFHSRDEILEALQAGHVLFAENRAQEIVDKFPDILAHHAGAAVHFIGSLQRNKVKIILPLVSCIQSVDRREILAEIGKEAAALQKTMPILFELHTGEDSKAGFAGEQSLFEAIDLLSEYPYLRCSGLMTMAPFTREEKPIRDSFRKAIAVRDECVKRYPSLDFSCISMGMTNDFEIAIEEGSTLLRIGTAIFGERA